ncbi:MAG: DUF2794 domain-containing protein [Hyphomicrobiaceae bacterium]|nr:DUF2794 domain-containing protein [Hyphomicrobiaceae bacterium]
MSDAEPIVFRPRNAGSTEVSSTTAAGTQASSLATAFNRQELSAIMDVYGRMVARGEWRDYALDLLRDKAVFSIFRRACEVPIYRIEKNPKLARKQGAFSVIAAGGLIMKRGHDLKRVLSVLDEKLQVVRS